MKQKIVEKKNNNLKTKKEQMPGKKACVLTLILQILVVLVLGCIAFLPALSGFLAFFLYVCSGIAVGIITIFTFGVIWINDEFRNFWSNAFSWIENLFKSPDAIVSGLKNSIVPISIIMFLISLSGFIVNLLFFIKHRKNLGLFITSCVFLVLGLLNMILAMVIYLNW